VATLLWFKTRRAIAAWTHAFTHPCHVLLAFQSTFACHAEQFVETGWFSAVE